MARSEREIVVNAGELADALISLHQHEDLEDSDAIRITHYKGVVRAGLVSNEPTGQLNPDDDEDEDDDDGVSYFGAAVARNENYEEEDEDEDDSLDVPLVNNTLFAED